MTIVATIIIVAVVLASRVAGLWHRRKGSL